MARLIVELTNRCNLRCGHCYAERHAATTELSSALLDRIIGEAPACGIDHVCFTGGEPTLSRQFAPAVRCAAAAGCTFSFVSNGSTFPAIVPLLREHRQLFRGVTLSLDGAREETHDALRGRGSFRQVMRAATLCVMNRFPFTVNVVMTAGNKGQIDEMVALAAALGARGIRFGHLMFNPEAATAGLELTVGERRTVEAQIWQLRSTAPVPVRLAPAHFHSTPFFPCAPLEQQEFNVDCRGNLTLCCQLSGHDEVNGADVVADLHDVPLREALQRFQRVVAAYIAVKEARVREGAFGELDYIPCSYCVNYMRTLPAGGERVRRLHVYRGHADRPC